MSSQVRVQVSSKPVLMGPPPIPKKMPVLPDSQFNYERIFGLNIYNFNDFLSDKQKALVIFYNSKHPRNQRLEFEFVSTARKRSENYHAFAAVNCLIEETLCKQEVINKLPILKIYSNGYEVSRMEDINNINSNQLHQLLDKTPVLRKPRDVIPLH